MLGCEHVKAFSALNPAMSLTTLAAQITVHSCTGVSAFQGSMDIFHGLINVCKLRN